MKKKRLAKLYYKRGLELAFKKKEYEEANKFFKKALEVKPNYLDALNGIAQNYKLNYKNYEKAIIYFTKIIDINPFYKNALYRRGSCKELLKDYIGRIDDLTILLDIKPSEEYYSSRARVEEKIGDFKEAIEDCTLGIELSNEKIRKLNTKGDYMFDVGKINKGMNAIDKAASLGDSQAIQYEMRADFKLKTLDFEGAIKDYEKARKLHENGMGRTCKSYNTRLWIINKGYGEAKHGLKDYEGAIEAFEKNVALRPGHLPSLELLNLAMSKLDA